MLDAGRLPARSAGITRCCTASATSFDTLPLLSLGVDRPLLDLLVGLLTAATALALRLAAPMFVTMLVVDLALGCIGKTMPQFNVMSAGHERSGRCSGMVVLIVGIGDDRRRVIGR